MFAFFVSYQRTILHGLTVSLGWFADTSENEEENKQRNMDAFTDQLFSQVNIPKPPIMHTETTTAVTEQAPAGPSRFVTASDQDLQRLMDKYTCVIYIIIIGVCYMSTCIASFFIFILIQA